MEIMTESTFCSSIIELVRKFTRKHTSSCKFLYNFNEGIFGANFNCSSQLIESIVDSIERFRIDSLETEADNEFQALAVMLRKTFLKITIKIKCKDNQYYKYEMTESLFEKAQIDKPNLSDDSDLSVTLTAGLQLVETEECLQNIENSLLLEALIRYKCLYQMIDLNTGKITLNIDRCNDLREQISRIKRIKYHNIYHKIAENSEICLYVNPILEEEKVCDQNVLLNYNRNSELEEHLASNLLPSINGINFVAIYKNDTGEINLIKQENFQLCVEILEFVQKNRDLALRKDSSEWLKEPTIDISEDNVRGTRLGLRSSRRPKKFLHNEKVDLTGEVHIKETNKEEIKESDVFLVITQDNENIFYEFTCSEHGNLIMNSPEPMDIKSCENVESFNNWIAQCSPSKKPDVEDNLSSYTDENLINSYTPVISSNSNSNKAKVNESKSKSVISLLEDCYNKSKVQRQRQKSSENFSDLEIVDGNSNGVIKKLPSIKDELINGKVKSNLFSANELMTYGKNMAYPWRSEKKLSDNYKIPKIQKYNLEKEAKAFVYFKNSWDEKIKNKLNETSPDVIYTGTSKTSSNGETKENFVSSLCRSLNDIEAPGLGDVLDSDFMTQREKSTHDNNTKKFSSAQSSLREHKEKYGNCSKDDDFEWTPVTSNKNPEKPRIDSPLVKAKNMLLGYFTSKKSEPSRIPKPEQDVSFINSRSLEVKNGNSSITEPYKFFKSKNNSTCPVFGKKTDDDVIEVADVSDCDSSSDTSRRSVHLREKKRDRDRKRLRLENDKSRSRRRSRSRTRSRSRSPRRDRSRDRKRKIYPVWDRKYKRSRSRSPNYLK